MTAKLLDGYSGQTTEQLIALEHEYRIDSLVLAVEEALQARQGDQGPSKEERYVLSIEGLEREVNNGGYRQFFLNASNEYVDVIEEALAAIGCSRTAAATRRAVDALGMNDQPTAQRAEAIVLRADDRLNEELETCTDLYLQSGEPLASSLFAWIKLNAERIRV